MVKGTLDDSDSAKIIRRFKSVQLISRVKDSMKAYEYVLFSDGCVGLFNMASKIYMIFGKDGDEDIFDTKIRQEEDSFCLFFINK